MSNYVIITPLVADDAEPLLKLVSEERADLSMYFPVTTARLTDRREAKRYVTDACFDVADQALQLHGGYGYLTEYGLEKIVRDLRVHRILEGTNEIMRVVIGRAEAARARAS